MEHRAQTAFSCCFLFSFSCISCSCQETPQKALHIGLSGPPTPQSVGNALQCVKLIGVWRATSKNRQHDWLRGMVNFKDASHSTSSSSSAQKSLSTHAMRKRTSPSYSSCSPLSVCMHCMLWNKRRAEKVDRMVNIWTRLATARPKHAPPSGPRVTRRCVAGGAEGRGEHRAMPRAYPWSACVRDHGWIRGRSGGKRAAALAGCVAGGWRSCVASWGGRRRPAVSGDGGGWRPLAGGGGGGWLMGGVGG